MSRFRVCQKARQRCVCVTPGAASKTHELHPDVCTSLFCHDESPGFCVMSKIGLLLVRILPGLLHGATWFWIYRSRLIFNSTHVWHCDYEDRVVERCLSSPRKRFLRRARHVRAIHASWTQMIGLVFSSPYTTSHDSTWIVLVSLVFHCRCSHCAVAQLAPARHRP